VSVHWPPRRVFLSHTEELSRLPEPESFVRAAQDAVLRAGDAVIEMRYFGARDEMPESVCRRKVRRADVFVLIAGMQYGSTVPERPDLSYCELEFNEATDAGLSRLVFLVDDGLDGPSDQFRDGGRTDVRQQRFRRRLVSSGLCAATVDGSEELATAVFQALTDLTIEGLRARLESTDAQRLDLWQQQRAWPAEMRRLQEQLAASVAEQERTTAANHHRANRVAHDLQQKIVRKDLEIEKSRATITELQQWAARDRALIDELTGHVGGELHTSSTGSRTGGHHTTGEPEQWLRWRCRGQEASACLPALDALLDATLDLDRAVDFTAARLLDGRDPDEDPALRLAGDYGRNELMAHYLAGPAGRYDPVMAPEMVRVLAATEELSRSIPPLREYCLWIGRELRRGRPRFRRVVHLAERFNAALTRAHHHADHLDSLLDEAKTWNGYAEVPDRVRAFVTERLRAFVALRTLQAALDDQTGFGVVAPDVLARYAEAAPDDPPLPENVAYDAELQIVRTVRASLGAVACQVAAPLLLGLLDGGLYGSLGGSAWRIVSPGVVLVVGALIAATRVLAGRGSGNGLAITAGVGVLASPLPGALTLRSGPAVVVAIAAGIITTVAGGIALRRYGRMQTAFRRNNVGRRQRQRGWPARSAHPALGSPDDPGLVVALQQWPPTALVPQVDDRNDVPELPPPGLVDRIVCAHWFMHAFATVPVALAGLLLTVAGLLAHLLTGASMLLVVVPPALLVLGLALLVPPRAHEGPTWVDDSELGPVARYLPAVLLFLVLTGGAVWVTFLAGPVPWWFLISGVVDVVLVAWGCYHIDGIQREELDRLLAYLDVDYY